jgi:hypothetical protein
VPSTLIAAVTGRACTIVTASSGLLAGLTVTTTRAVTSTVIAAVAGCAWTIVTAAGLLAGLAVATRTGTVTSAATTVITAAVAGCACTIVTAAGLTIAAARSRCILTVALIALIASAAARGAALTIAALTIAALTIAALAIATAWPGLLTGLAITAARARGLTAPLIASAAPASTLIAALAATSGGVWSVTFYAAATTAALTGGDAALPGSIVTSALVDGAECPICGIRRAADRNGIVPNFRLIAAGAARAGCLVLLGRRVLSSTRPAFASFAARRLVRTWEADRTDVIRTGRIA